MKSRRGYVKAADDSFRPTNSSPRSVPASSSRSRVASAAALAVVITAMGWSWKQQPNKSCMMGIIGRSNANDITATMYLADLYTLQLINSTTGSALPTDRRLFELARSYYDKALSLSPASCQPVLGKAMLQFAMGDDDDTAVKMFKASRTDECIVQAELMMGYINELSGDITAATARFDTASRLDPAVVHENFYIRQDNRTIPTLAPSMYANRLRKLVAFRDRFVRLHDATSDGDEGRLAFLPAKTAVGPSVGVDIKAGSAQLSTIKHILIDQEFIVLRSFLTQWEVQQLHGYYADLIDRGVIDNLDPEPSRSFAVNDRLGHWLLQRMTPLMNEIAEQPVKHVKSFLAWYRTVPGAKPPILDPHTDRDGLEFTVSIQMHFDDELGAKSWPLWVHTRREEEAPAGWRHDPPRSESIGLNLEDGDAVLFRGSQHIHWRDAMPDSGRSFSSLLLHYVPYPQDSTGISRQDPTV